MISSDNTLKEQSFKDFLYNKSGNRIILYLAALAIVLQFGIFKYLYPFVSYIHGDSFSYLEAADQNLSISTYMIGYSKFLRLFSVFNKTDYTLSAFQYLFIQCSALYLLFTIFYFYKTGRPIQYVLLCFMVLNPLFLHLGNLVSSDCMFAGLSFIWFALLLWNIHQPSTKTIAWHAVILFLAFTFRYNALIYPFITMIAFGLSKLPIRAKLVGASYGIILCGIFVCFTMYKYKQFTGYWQYSPFSGWQMANNAMYAYRSVDSADRGPVPLKYQALDNMIKDFYAKTNNGNVFPSEKALASTFYMWTPSMPLMRYRDSIFKLKDPKAGEFKKWASMGPFYKSYGMYIIKKYPYHFAEWFLWPNTRKYFAPPVEFLENYNSGRDAVTDQAKVWFGYKSVKVKSRLNNPHIWILAYYPIVTGIINILMLFGLLYYVLLKGWRINDVFNKTIIIGGAVWMFNAFFTIFASSAALRFQTFPILLTTIIALLLVDWLSQLLRSMNLNKRQVTIEEKEGNVFVA